MTVRLKLTDYQLAVAERMLDTTSTTSFDQLAAAAVARRAAPDQRWRQRRPPKPEAPRAPEDVNTDAVLPAASGASLTLSAGQQLRIEQITDGQCVDLQVFEPGGRSFSAARTRAIHGIHPTVGASLWSIAPEVPLLTIVADTAPSHDLCFPPCSEGEYERHAGIAGHLGCAELHEAARAGAPKAGDDVLNLWLPSAVDHQGQLQSWPVACRRGDYIDLRADRDVVVTLSTCPDDLFGSSQYEPGPVRIIVSGGGARNLATTWPTQPPASTLARNEIIISLPDTALSEVDQVLAMGWLGYDRPSVLRALIFRLHESLAR